jgi:hypothetical protein
LVTVARQLKGERVIIAKVDAEEAEKIATKFGVDSYPTIIWSSPPARHLHFTNRVFYVTLIFLSGLMEAKR